MSETSTKIDATGPQVYNSRIIKYLTKLESTKKCAGVCKTAKFFPFTDIKNGPPSQSCFNSIIEDLSHY